MEKEIEVLGRKVKVKEIKYVDLIDIDPNNKKESAVKFLKYGSDLTDAEIAQLTTKEGNIVMKEINELNGFGDFQKP